MAHIEQSFFCYLVKSSFPEYFMSKSILDVGSGDVNWNNRYLFDNSYYIGVDAGIGKNVDIVSFAHQLPFKNDHSFDFVISTEMLEHDPYWNISLKSMFNALKSGGMLIITCASVGRPEHGTRDSTPNESLATLNELIDFRDYYMNLSVKDFTDTFDLERDFYAYELIHNDFSHDLYFCGIKGDTKLVKVSESINLKKAIFFDQDIELFIKTKEFFGSVFQQQVPDDYINHLFNIFKYKIKEVT
jgi:SAM-dependent methyltransferase